LELKRGGIGGEERMNQSRGPSSYDVHTEGERSGSDGRMWMGEGVQPHVDVHTEN